MSSLFVETTSELNQSVITCQKPQSLKLPFISSFRPYACLLQGPHKSITDKPLHWSPLGISYLCHACQEGQLEMLAEHARSERYTHTETMFSVVNPVWSWQGGFAVPPLPTHILCHSSACINCEQQSISQDSETVVWERRGWLWKSEFPVLLKRALGTNQNN